MCSNSEIPTVDLTGLHPTLPSGDQWEAAKSDVTAALHSHGCFEAIYPSLSPELRQELFSNAMPELFSLPLQSKLRSTSSEEPYQGYIAPTPSLAYESLRIDAADSPTSIQNFTNLMWPQGNPAFHNATVAFTKALRELAEMVQKMVLQRLGVEEKRYDEFVNSINHGIRLSEYGVPVDQETKIGLPSHVDPNYLSIVCQHEIGGLEVQIADGSFWIRAETNPNSVYVMAGLAFQAAVAFVKPLQELAEIVQKMILQRLGVEEYYDEFVKSTERGIRISSYGVPPDQETKIGMRCHFDPNLLSIVCQHEIGGLEFQTDDGSGWINAEPTINSVYVIAGQALQAWSNKSVRAPLHRVRMLGDNMRFSAIYATRPNRSFVKSLEELGDNGRPPMLFKPINYTEFTKFVMSSEQGVEQGP